MNIQKEREAFEDKFPIPAHWIDFDGLTCKYICKYNAIDDQALKYQARWEAWLAAKAQAVPKGFVLIKDVHPDSIIHNQGLGLFKECQVIYGWNGKSKDFKDALNKGFYHGVKLGAKAVLETAMIEVQEQSYV